MHVLPVSGEFYLDAIERGEKTLEGRVNHKRVQNIEKEAIVNFFDSKSNKGVVVGVIDKRHYNSFKEMLQAEDPVKLLPQLAEKKLTKAKLVSEGEKIYKAFPGAEREKDLGVVCLEIKFIKRVNSTKII